jgi:hypothetical protein
MNTHTKFSRQRILTVLATTFLFHTTYAANNKQPFQEPSVSKKRQTRAFPQASAQNQVEQINANTNRAVRDSTTVITGGTGTTLNDISAQVGELGEQIGEVLPELNIAIGELEVAAGEIETAAGEITAAATSLTASAEELASIVDDLATSTQANEILDELNTIEGGEDFDAETDSLHAIAAAIAGIAPINLTGIEGPGFTSASNSLASISGTGVLGSGSSNTFDPTKNSLADMCGTGFVSDINSLVNLATSAALGAPVGASISADIAAVQADVDTILTNQSTQGTAALATFDVQASQGDTISAINTAVITNIPATLADIEGGEDFVAETDSLHAISVAIGEITPTDISTLATIIQVNNLGSEFDTSSLYNDIVALGNTGDISNINTRFNTVDTAIDALPTNAELATALSPLATTVQLNSAVADIEGEGFVSADNSLVAITDAIANIATTANITTLGTPSDVSGIYDDFVNLGTPSDISGIYARLSNMQQTLAFIVAQLIGDPIVAVDQAATNPTLTTTVTVTGSHVSETATYNADITIALAAATFAIGTTTQTYANTTTAIGALATAILSFNNLANALAADSNYVTSGYSAAEINAALVQLNTALGYLLTQQVA